MEIEPMESKSMESRLYNIDFLKGILILFVIAGHYILGAVDDNFIRYTIYSFHMPIFIGISGFLINRSKLAALSPKELIKKYFPRLLIPWSIAIITYVTIIEWERLGRVGLRDFIYLYARVFLKPYYHLWFILGFLGYIFVTWCMLKLRFKTWMMIAVATVVSIISKYEIYEWYEITNEKLLDIIVKLHYDFRIYNLLFFIIGMLLREYLSRQPQPKKLLQITVILLMAASVYNVYLYFYDFNISKRMIYYVLNLPLLYLLLNLAKRGVFPRSRGIEYIGKNSMAFYLWHVIPLIASKNMVGEENTAMYYILCLSFLGITTLLIYLLSKISFINRYLFGALQK
jgi:fucose 4-O-acetylase-like acetyltransferase